MSQVTFHPYSEQSVALRDLAHVLGDGQFHQMTALCAQLGVSVETLSAQLQALSACAGLIEVDEEGVRSTHPFEIYRPEALTDALNATSHARELPLLLCFDIDSTNDLLAREMRAGLTIPAFALADSQRTGRGRRGRVWQSPLGSNIYLSLAWRFRRPLNALSGLSLAVGLAIAEAIEAETGLALGLKWPNDLFLGGRKCGGILVDLSVDRDSVKAIIGIGLNVGMPGDVAHSIDQPWADLRGATENPICRTSLTAHIIDALVLCCQRFDQSGFTPYWSRWRERDILRGKALMVLGDNARTGYCEGVNEEGALLLRTAEGVEVIQGGEVSVRPADRVEP